MDKKRSVGIMLTGIGMLVYAFLFTVPWIASAKMYIYSGKSIYKIITDVFYYIHLYKIYGVVLLLSGIWLIYLIAAIGVIRHKEWARIIAVYANGLLAIFSLVFWLGAVLVDVIIRPVGPGTGWGSGMGFLFLIIPICLPSLSLFIILTHPKVKERFKQSYNLQSNQVKKPSF